MTRLADAFDQLGRNDKPRGAADVLAAAESTARRHRRRRRAAAALGTAAAVAVAVVAWPSDDPEPDRIDVVDTPTSTNSTTTMTAPATTTTAVEAESVVPEEVGHSLLLFGVDGISSVSGGTRTQRWDQPVIAAFGDGRGGVAFQDTTTSPADGELYGAIRWLPAGSSDPIEITAPGPSTRLVGVLPAGPDVLFTRLDDHPDPEVAPVRLYARVLATGVERELGVVGGQEWGLHSAAMADVGLLVSTCHFIECQVHVLDGGEYGERVHGPDESRGLDAEGDVFAVVRSGGPTGDADYHDLVVERIGGEPVDTVRLPSLPFGDREVDLSPDGGSALVWTVIYGEGGPAISSLLVEGIGSAAPTIRQLAAAGGARFG